MGMNEGPSIAELKIDIAEIKSLLNYPDEDVIIKYGYDPESLRDELFVLEGVVLDMLADANGD